VNADQSFKGDVLLQRGVVTAVGTSVAFPPGTLLLNATGMLVMPGGIDPHTHLDMPFMGTISVDDFLSGHRAAVAGGTTYHLDFALPVDHDLMAGYSLWQTKAKAGCLDYSLHSAVTSWDDGVAAAMAQLVGHGVNSFKFFLAYKGALMVTDAELLRGMRVAKDLGALTMVHCENGEAVDHGRSTVFDSGVTGPHGHALSRPVAVEDEATGRAIKLAGILGAPLYIVHTTTAGAAQLVAEARARGQRVLGEPVLSGLVLDESVMWDPNYTVAAAAVMSPPIRKLAVDGAALRAGLATGVLGPLGTVRPASRGVSHLVCSDFPPCSAGPLQLQLHPEGARQERLQGNPERREWHRGAPGPRLRCSGCLRPGNAHGVRARSLHSRGSNVQCVPPEGGTCSGERRGCGCF
jgi:dihydropyrimidinase